MNQHLNVHHIHHKVEPLCPFLPPSNQPPFPFGKCSSVVCLYKFVFCFVLFVLFSYSTHKSNHVVFVFFCLMYFTQHNSLKVLTCCDKCQDFTIVIALQYYIVCVCTSHIFCIHSSMNGHLSCSHFLTIVNNAAINIGVHIFFQISVFVFFG